MIINTTTGKVISQDEISCTSFLSQMHGLMFRGKKNVVMIFPTERKISLHMFFVFYPIDVLLVNEQKKIVEVKRDFKPFTTWRSEKKGKYVVELAQKGVYQEGDALKIC